MSYADQSAYYEDPSKRTRIDICVREQALIFLNDLRPEVIKLAQEVTANNYGPITSVTAAVIVGPNFTTLDQDASLLAAVQATFPVVAASTYPELVA